MAEEDDITESEATCPPYQPAGRDLLEKYMIELDYKPINPLDRYISLIKLVTIGMELLPYYDDEEEQEKIDTLYAKAAEVLKIEIPAKRTVNYGYVDHGGKRFEVYKIQAIESKDAGEYQILEKDLKDGMNNFISMQHEQHISKLQAVHNQILHKLTLAGTVPLVNPSFENMKNEMKKQFLNDIMNMPEPETKEGKDAIR